MTKNTFFGTITRNKSNAGKLIRTEKFKEWRDLVAVPCTEIPKLDPLGTITVTDANKLISRIEKARDEACAKSPVINEIKGRLDKLLIHLSKEIHQEDVKIETAFIPLRTSKRKALYFKLKEEPHRSTELMRIFETSTRPENEGNILMLKGKAEVYGFDFVVYRPTMDTRLIDKKSDVEVCLVTWYT